MTRTVPCSILQQDKSLIDFVMRAHSGQFRKTGEPFYMHPIRMYEAYLQSGGTDLFVRQAILLHDAIEDTELNFREVQNKFGEYTAWIVEANTGCSDSGDKLSKYEFVEKFVRFSRKDYRCLIVKLFDCIDNLQTIHGLSLERQIRFKNEKRRIYLPIFVSMMDLVPNQHKSLYVKKVERMRLLLS